MPTKLNKWGNSLGLRLPQYVVDHLTLRAGDHMYINVTDAGEIVISAVRPRENSEFYGPSEGLPATRSPEPPMEW
jgi:antitoxin component of MazEF toxin-antitoxin module